MVVMNDTKLIEALSNASSLELFELSAIIDRLLADRYAISAFAAVDLRKTAEEFEAEAPDTVRFTRALKEAVPYEDRITLMEALWSVALTDGTRSADEDAALRLVASLLGINDRDSALARQRMDRS